MAAAAAEKMQIGKENGKMNAWQVDTMLEN